MISLKRRLGIYAAIWFLFAVGFAFAPYPPSEYKESQERIGAFFETPLLVTVGLSSLLPWSSEVPFGCFVVTAFYIVGHAVMTLSRREHGPFAMACGVHLIHAAIGLCGFVHFCWNDVGG